MPVNLATIILNYRTADMTAHCLASLAGSIDYRVQVVVVDNASGDGSAERIEAVISGRGWSSWARVIRSPANRGFSGGMNVGIQAIDADAYLLLNSDSLIRPGLFRSVSEAMQANELAGIIGLAILDERGNPVPSHFRYISPASEFIRAANTGPITESLRRFYPPLPPTDVPVESDWVSFAGVAIRREVIEDIGLLDEGYFMYFEDVDYCRRARRAGWRILRWPQARIVHFMGGSSGLYGNGAERRRAPRYYYAARARYFAKYYGQTGLILANCLWCAGRVVSFARQIGGRPAAHRKGEASDIWTRPAQHVSPTGKRPG